MEVITTLARVVPSRPGKPVRTGAVERQAAARATALGEPWTAERAGEVAARFDELARTWDSERGGYRRAPVEDALERGGPFAAGLCVEVGCGTGLLTPLLQAVWSPVVGLDLSPRMLSRSRSPFRVRADGARLPVPDGAASAVVIGDAPLFAGEVVRVLRTEGAVVWSNALGDGAPYYVATPVLLDALSEASGTTWRAVESEAGWGSWTVLRRQATPG